MWAASLFVFFGLVADNLINELEKRHTFFSPRPFDTVYGARVIDDVKRFGPIEQLVVAMANGCASRKSLTGEIDINRCCPDTSAGLFAAEAWPFG